MLYYLRKLGCSHIVWQFEEWNKNVQEEIFNSPEFNFSIYRKLILDAGAEVDKIREEE